MKNPFVDDWYEKDTYADDEGNDVCCEYQLEHDAYLLKVVLNTEAAPDDEKRWTGHILEWDSWYEDYYPIQAGPYSVHAATLQEAKSKLLGLFIAHAENVVEGLEKNVKEWHEDIELMKAAHIRTQMGAA